MFNLSYKFFHILERSTYPSSNSEKLPLKIVVIIYNFIQINFKNNFFLILFVVFQIFSKLRKIFSQY